MMAKASVQKQAYWRGVLRHQQKSGLTVRQFCMEGQLSEASFYSWRRKFAGRDCQARTASEKDDRRRSKAKRVVKRNQNEAVFIPVRLSAAAGSLEVVHPRGHIVRIPAVFDENCLRQVLTLLDQQGGS